MLKVQIWWTSSPRKHGEERDSNANIADPTFAMPLMQVELNGLGAAIPVDDVVRINTPPLRADCPGEHLSAGASVERPRDAQWRTTADTTPTGHAMACAVPSET